MNRQTGRLEFKLGAFGRLVPLLTAACMILWAACSQSNVTAM